MVSLSAGVFEFSNVIHTRLLIEAGLTDGARYYARCRHGDDATEVAACTSDARNLAATGTVDGSGNARVKNWTESDVSVSYTSVPIVVIDTSTGEQNYRASGSHTGTVRLSTSYSYTGTGLLKYLGFSPLVLSLEHEERVIGW
jgi:Flp pilus assembly protein TadG